MKQKSNEDAHLLVRKAARKMRRSIISLFGIVSIVLFGNIIAVPTTYAAAVPGGNIANPVVRAVDIAEPAVVRMLTTLGGRLTVHFTSTISPTFPLDGGTYKLEYLEAVHLSAPMEIF